MQRLVASLYLCLYVATALPVLVRAGVWRYWVTVSSGRVRPPELLAHPNTGSLVVPEEVFARQKSPKGARETGFLVFFVPPPSPKGLRTARKSGLGRHLEDFQSRTLTLTEVLFFLTTPQNRQWLEISFHVYIKCSGVLTKRNHRTPNSTGQKSFATSFCDVFTGVVVVSTPDSPRTPLRG